MIAEKDFLKIPIVSGGSMQNRYDAIIIGSGIGGLTAASLLGRVFEKKVLILEQHFKPGGFTHIFKRKDWEWDVGVHYVGNMDKSNFLRKLFDYLTQGNLEWNRMQDPFDEFVYPDLRFSVTGDPEAYRQQISEMFPQEKDAIARYFRDIESVASVFFSFFTRHGRLPLPEDYPEELKKLGSLSTGEYLELNFQDKKLKALLSSRWGNYGLPPSQSSFLIHALMEYHYFHGGWYPLGGAGKIAKTILPAIQQNGGEILLSHRVEKILLDKDRAIGVEVSELQGDKVKEKKEFFADIIISNAGIYNTYFRLLPAESELYRKIMPLQKEMDSILSRGTSTVSLFLGLEDTPSTDGRNYWIHRTWDHEENFRRRNEITGGSVYTVFVSFPSMKNLPEYRPTAEIITFADYEVFARWKDQPWKQRDGKYQELKHHITQSLIAFVDTYMGNFSQYISYTELSTPLSNEFFSLHPRGIIYGLPSVPERFLSGYMQPQTPVRNLYIAGADTGFPGIAGAMLGGCAAVSSIMNNREFLKKITET